MKQLKVLSGLHSADEQAGGIFIWKCLPIIKFEERLFFTLDVCKIKILRAV